MKRVLVTGATGFIGRNALQPLLACAEEVHAVSSRARPAGAPAGVRWHRADLLSREGAELVAELAPSHLLHLAWYAEPGRFWSAPENLDWAGASLRLVRAFAEAGGQRAVIAGTCAEYAWEAHTHCRETVTPLAPATLYGTAKHATHMTLAAYSQDVQLQLAWGRIFFVFGPHEHPARLVGSVASALLEGREANCSPGEQVRDFLFAPELAAAFVALLATDVVGPVNLASGRPMRVRELVEAIAAATGHPQLLRLGALAANTAEPQSLTADVTRLRDEVGWSPAVGFEDAVRETVDWWRERAA